MQLNIHIRILVSLQCWLYKSNMHWALNSYKIIFYSKTFLRSEKLVSGRLWVWIFVKRFLTNLILRGIELRWGIRRRNNQAGLSTNGHHLKRTMFVFTHVIISVYEWPYCIEMEIHFAMTKFTNSYILHWLIGFVSVALFIGSLLALFYNLSTYEIVYNSNFKKCQNNGKLKLFTIKIEIDLKSSVALINTVSLSRRYYANT